MNAKDTMVSGMGCGCKGVGDILSTINSGWQTITGELVGAGQTLAADISGQPTTVLPFPNQTQGNGGFGAGYTEGYNVVSAPIQAAIIGGAGTTNAVVGGVIQSVGGQIGAALPDLTAYPWFWVAVAVGGVFLLRKIA